MSEATGDRRQATANRKTPGERAAFRERLAYYLLGVAISCVFLGMVYSAKQRMKARAEAEKAAAAQTQAAPGK